MRHGSRSTPTFAVHPGSGISTFLRVLGSIDGTRRAGAAHWARHWLRYPWLRRVPDPIATNVDLRIVPRLAGKGGQGQDLLSRRTVLEPLAADHGEGRANRPVSGIELNQAEGDDFSDVGTAQCLFQDGLVG